MQTIFSKNGFNIVSFSIFNNYSIDIKIIN